MLKLMIQANFQVRLYQRDLKRIICDLEDAKNIKYRLDNLREIPKNLHLICQTSI